MTTPKSATSPNSPRRLPFPPDDSQNQNGDRTSGAVPVDQARLNSVLAETIRQSFSRQLGIRPTDRSCYWNRHREQPVDTGRRDIDFSSQPQRKWNDHAPAVSASKDRGLGIPRSLAMMLASRLPALPAATLTAMVLPSRLSATNASASARIALAHPPLRRVYSGWCAYLPRAIPGAKQVPAPIQESGRLGGGDGKFERKARWFLKVRQSHAMALAALAPDFTSSATRPRPNSRRNSNRW